jgi:hypothetical protein
MVGTLENPTLDLNPALPETLDVITATRSGTATYTDPDGNIATAAADTVRVDYTQGEELTPTKYQHVVQTDYSASPNGIGSRVTLSDISGPDGESGGVRITETADTTQHHLSVIAREIVAGTTYTFSFYIKEGTYSSVGFYTQSAKVTSNVIMNFSTGTASFGGADLVSNSGSFTSVGDGWYRVVYSATANGSGEMDLYVTIKDLSSYAGDVNNFIDYYGFQVEEGTTASDFVSNTTGSPKFIASATYGPRVPMILVEPSSENLLVESNAFFNSADATKTTGIDAPDGTNTAINIGNILAGTSDRANSSYAIVTGSTDYSGSVYVRGNAGDVVAVYIKRVTGSFVSSPIRHVTLTGDWQRVENINITTLADNTQLRLFVYKDNSVTADSVDLWGGQIEVGSVSTSVIPTSGSTVTRQADDLVISGSDFTDFYNQSEGTFYVESVPNENTSGSFLFDLSFGNASTERLTIYNSGANQKVYIRTSGTTWGDNIIGNRPAGGVISRVAISCKTNNIQASIDGSNMTPDTSATMSTSINKMTIGNRYENPNYFNGRIRRLIFWPYHSDSL